MDKLERIAALDNEVQAQLVDTILSNRRIPHIMRTYHDSAYDGLFQSSMGWGHIEAPHALRNEILDIIEDVRRRSSSSATTPQPPDRDEKCSTELPPPVSVRRRAGVRERVVDTKKTIVKFTLWGAFLLGFIGGLVGFVAAFSIWPESNLGPPVGAVYGFLAGILLGAALGCVLGILRVLLSQWCVAHENEIRTRRRHPNEQR